MAPLWCQPASSRIQFSPTHSFAHDTRCRERIELGDRAREEEAAALREQYQAKLQELKSKYKSRMEAVRAEVEERMSGLSAKLAKARGRFGGEEGGR